MSASAPPRGRLVVVTGKGGAGKSTVAAALGLAAARGGLRTIVAEVAGRADVPRLLGEAPGSPGGERRLEAGLHHVSVDADRALDEYLREQLPRVLADTLAHSRLFRPLAAAAPGLRELVTIGQVWEIAQRPRLRRRAPPYDLVVLDAPASGHARALLGAPRTWAAMARRGRVARQAGEIAAFLDDPDRTAVVAVATAEEMSVNEALMLAGGLGRRLDHFVLDGLLPEPLHRGDARALRDVRDDPAVGSALWLHRRVRGQRAQAARLRAATGGAPVAVLPFVFAAELDRGDVERLSRGLEEVLG